MNFTLPPEYAQKGYEVVSMSGKVIKVVPPAMSVEEAAKQASAKQQAEVLAVWDKRLRLRYSSVADIESAKQRKLAEIESNVSILRGNLRSLKGEIAQHESRAANSERAGREVPQAILDTLAALRQKQDNIIGQIQQRKQESIELVERFDRDIERFKVIRPDN